MTPFFYVSGEKEISIPEFPREASLGKGVVASEAKPVMPLAVNRVVVTRNEEATKITASNGGSTENSREFHRCGVVVLGRQTPVKIEITTPRGEKTTGTIIYRAE